MTEAEWLMARPDAILEFQRGKVSDRKLRLFACACCRRVWDLLTDFRSRHVVEVVEGVADGVVNELQLPYASEQAMAAFKYLIGAPYAAACTAHVMPEGARNVCSYAAQARSDWKAEQVEQSRLARDIFGNPFRPVTLNLLWLTSTVVALANSIYREKAFDRMPILADALQDAGCDNAEVLNHCRQPGEHVRGCWVVDLLMGTQ